MARFYYHNKIGGFLTDPHSLILGELAKKPEFSLEEKKRDSWNTQVVLLKEWLENVDGDIIFEYSIPRMGKRIDCVLISAGIVFAVEFKVGARSYESHAIDQVMDYALDLKNFHAQSHNKTIIPILICT